MVPQYVIDSFRVVQDNPTNIRCAKVGSPLRVKIAKDMHFSNCLPKLHLMSEYDVFVEEDGNYYPLSCILQATEPSWWIFEDHMRECDGITTIEVRTHLLYHPGHESNCFVRQDEFPEDIQKEMKELTKTWLTIRDILLI